MSYRVLTGITTTGTPHLGNYVGAIRPAIAASREPGVESFFFLADYHALIKCDEPGRIERSRLELAATWLACGLDPQRVVFYRQSDIPEITELTWLLTCVTPKGLMNRAHAYKAASDENAAKGEDTDAGISMGLFSYPILMGADILMFNAHRVPVGRDQVQHIEMARDMGQRFNHLFGQGRELFVLPEAVIDEVLAMLPGLDGRKMSKSYDNIIPLFEGGSTALKDAVARIVTDSRLPGEPKDADNAHLVTIYDAFATPAERSTFRAELKAGLGWGDAKQKVVEQLEREIAPMRAHYNALMAHPARIEDILMEGARKARAIASPLLATLREAVGLRRFQPRGGAVGASVALQGQAIATATGKIKIKPPEFKQYREGGEFYFKLVASDGRLLLQSRAFATGKEAGQGVATLRGDGIAGLARAGAALVEGVTEQDVAEALAALAAA